MDSEQAPATVGNERLHLLLNAHGDRLLRSAYLLCGNLTEAEDLVQETLLQAILSADRFRGESEVYTWLHGILLNKSRRYWRGRKRFLTASDQATLEVAIEDNVQNPGDREYVSRQIASAVRALSVEQREVIVLRFYENLKIDEIALRIGVSPGTVKSRLHYALRFLEARVPPELNHFTSTGT